MVRLMVGERRLTGHEKRRAGRTRRGRGRAVVQCDGGAVTHFPYLIATHLHLLTQLTCNSAAARTHAPSHSRVTRASSELHARTHQTRTALHANLCSCSLLCCHRIMQRYVYPRQYNLNSTQLSL